MTLLFLAALGTVVVSFVLYPVLSREVAPAGESSSDAAPELQRLAEAKQRLLESVKDVEFEYKAGKLSEADYQRVRADDLAQVAQIMARIDAMTGNKNAPAESEATASAEPEDSGTTCKSCQQVNPAEARFCLRCGKPIPHTLECSKCGVELPAEAQFCILCGTAVQT
jgi:type IV secretory pathway VirB10-like protein